jgi:hypothetical protein
LVVVQAAVTRLDMQAVREAEEATKLELLMQVVAGLPGKEMQAELLAAVQAEQVEAVEVVAALTEQLGVLELAV